MKTILMVLLAKSYKPGGRCIAGREVEYVAPKKVTVGNWIRPVADNSEGTGALTPEIYTYEDGTEAKVLDIVEVPVIDKASVAGQPENYIVDQTKKWKKVCHLNPSSIPKIEEKMESIWLDQDTDSNKATASYDEKGLISQSLCLIKPSEFKITLSNVFDDYEGSYKKKIVASFDYLGIKYSDISITCPAVRKVLTNQYPKDGENPVTISLTKGDDYILCMSLSPRFGKDNFHYKLVATTFDFDGYLQSHYSS
ncbi:MAG: dual OB domain-containing protein [Aeromonas veronii]